MRRALKKSQHNSFKAFMLSDNETCKAYSTAPAARNKEQIPTA